MTVSSPSTLARQAGTSHKARRAIRWRPSLSHLLIGLVILLAFFLNYLALQDRNEVAMVAVADQPLVAGSSLELSALRFVPISADFEAIDSLVVEDGAAAVDGWIVRRTIEPGAIVDRSTLTEPGAPTGFRSMSLAVPVEHAVGGTLLIGDRIDVITVDEGVAGYVVSDIEVLGVSDDEGAFGTLGDYHVVVAVDAEQALKLASALDSGSVEIVRSTGAVPYERQEVADGH